MINEELLKWVREQMAGGATKEQVKAALLGKGWQEKDVEEAFSMASGAGEQPLVSGTPLPSITSLPGVFVLLGDAWKLYTARWGTFIGILIVPMLLFVLFFGAVAGGAIGFSLFAPFFKASGLILLVVLIFAFLIGIFVVQGWGAVALLYAVKDSEERIGIRESYRRAWGKIASYWWILLLSGCITFGGYLLLIIPGIILTISLSLAVFIFVSENERGLNALLKSREYVRGIWWKVFWRVVFIGVLSWIILVVVALGLGTVSNAILESVINFGVNLVTIPLATAYFYSLYRNVRALKGESIVSRGSKAGLIAFGLFGLLLIPGFIIGAIYLGTRKSDLPISPRSTYGFPSLKNNTNQGISEFPTQEDATRQLDLSQLRLDLEAYFDTHNKYPNSLQELPGKVPTDPVTGTAYTYKLRQSEKGWKGYELCAMLDTGEQKCVRPPGQ